MITSKKKVEVFLVKFRTEGKYSFDEILKCNDVAERDLKVKQKNVTLKILKTAKDYLVGIVETSRDQNIPPKKHRKKKTISKLGLDAEEGLAYANVFLFDRKKNIMMYEVNKFGCFVDHFITYIYKCCKGHEKYQHLVYKLNRF
jgi:hypothetical protein